MRLGKTALDRFAVLEGLGRYDDGTGDPPREVTVRFGEASLTLLDGDDTPLDHWAIASLVERTGLAMGLAGVSYAPDPDASARLTTEDRDLIAAIREVRAGLKPQRAKSRWPGRIVALGVIALLIVGGYLASPRIAAWVATEMPAEAETALDDRLLAIRAERVCDTAEGRAAFAQLAARMRPHVALRHPLEVVVLASSSDAVFPTPGGRVILTEGALRAAETDAGLVRRLTGAVSAMALRRPAATAVRATPPSALRAVWTGADPGVDALRRIWSALRAQPPIDPSTDEIAQRLMVAAGYGDRTRADGAGAPRAAPLDDNAAVALRQICG